MVIKVSELRNIKGGGTYADLDDRMLVLDFQAGNPEAYIEIHRRYAGLARHICQRILGNPDDADEAAQEAMIRVFQGLGRFNGRYAVQPWVARIATNVSLDVTRTRARRPQIGDRPLHELPDEPSPHVEDDPGEMVERLLEADRVQEVLSSMPSHHRDALVLREFEGLSHKEIGDALGVSPPQAKALIHRAKGTFRRLWDGRDGERRGLAAFVPFVFFGKLFGLFRRVADRATEAGQQIAATQVATVVSATPAAPAAASQTAERVVAAAVTLIVAGGVTVGAATLTHHRAEPLPTKAPVVAPFVQPSTQPPVQPTTALKPRVKDPKAQRGPVGGPGAGTSPSPIGTPSPTPTESPSGSPTPDPTPTTDPSGSPTPPVLSGPAPEWSGAFNIDWPSDSSCDCGPGVTLGSSSTSGQLTADTALDVQQTLSGAAADAEGDAAWSASVQYGAHLEAGSGHLNLVFVLGDASGNHGYSGYASSVAQISGTPGNGSPTVYTFAGTYVLEEGNSDTSPIPTQGQFNVQVSIWGDGTAVYASQVLLHRQ